MAKKKTSTAKSSAAGKAKGGAAAGPKSGASKKTTKKTPKKTGKKTTRKVAKTTTKKTTKKAPAKKPTPKKKSETKKTSKKPSTKKAPAKKSTQKKAPAKTTTSKKTTKKAPTKKVATTPAEPPKAKPEPTPPPPPPPASANQKPARPSRPKRPKPPAAVMPEGIGGLLSPGGPARKPLIASSQRVEPDADAKAEKYPTKSPFNKRELQKFRDVLLRKRNEVLSEVTGLEGGALTGGGSGNLSKTPQHMADAGSDAADQTLSLDLAAAERNLIKEIDAALKRIEDGVFGLCVATGKPIRKERLQELPWAQYSIDAARQLEGKR